MSNDAGNRLPDPPRAQYVMPKVLDIVIRATKYRAPQHRNFESALKSSDQAVEFIVTTAGPIPQRALGPALYVGTTAVTEGAAIGPNKYRFVALTRKGLEPSAPIVLGWTGKPPKEGKKPAFRYRP